MGPSGAASPRLSAKFPYRRRTLALALLTYLVLALSLAWTKAPWCDEAWFVNPAYNLAFHGNMGSNVLEPSGYYLNVYMRDVQQRTYIYPPNHFIVLAGWFRIFGFSAFLARAYSVCWSALMMIALFYVLLRMFPDRRVPYVAFALLCIEFIFLWSTADGRPEAMANSLAFCSVAVYLHFREQKLALAVWASQCFAAAGVFAHLNASLIVLSLTAMACFLDRGRLGIRHLALAAGPYLVAAGLWATYILQKPSDFLAQFLPQAGWSQRWQGLFRPDIAIGTEIDRHLAAYCLNGLWPGVMNGWMIIIPLLYLSAVIWFWRSRRKLEKTEQAFLLFTLVLMCGMTFLNGFKGYFYLIYIVPVYVAVFSAWLLHLWSRSKEARYVAGILAATFIVLQLSTSIQHIRADEYHRDYLPAVQDLLRYRNAGKSIVGTAALGFGLNFRGFKDDIREGTYSGLSPDVLVVDRSYRKFAGMFATNEPPVFTHIVETLSTKYRFVAQHGSFWIFERRAMAAGPADPWLDLAKLQNVEKGQRASAFFRLIFKEAKLHDAEESSL